MTTDNTGQHTEPLTLSEVVSGSTLKKPFLSNWNLSYTFAPLTDRSIRVLRSTVSESCTTQPRVSCTLISCIMHACINTDLKQNIMYLYTYITQQCYSWCWTVQHTFNSLLFPSLSAVATTKSSQWFSAALGTGNVRASPVQWGIRDWECKGLSCSVGH